MRIVIAGAGAVGTHLAKMLSVENENVVLLDESEEKLAKMETSFDLQTIVGDPTKISALVDAGVGRADLFVAVTPDESRNITACILAHYLGAEKTIARIDNYEYLQPKHKEYFASLGVDSLIYPEQLAAEEIATSIKYSWMRQLLEFGNGALVMVGVKAFSSQAFSTPLSLRPSQLNTSTSLPMFLRYCATTLKGDVIPAEPTSNS